MMDEQDFRDSIHQMINATDRMTHYLRKGNPPFSKDKVNEMIALRQDLRAACVEMLEGDVIVDSPGAAVGT